MSKIFFTSDTHFGHANIIGYCNRPFSSIEEMDAELIERWNTVVSPGDTVYHLGDFCMGDVERAGDYFPQLNGNIHILLNRWHHDQRWQAPFFKSMIDLSVPSFPSQVYKSRDGLAVRSMPPITVLEYYEYSQDGKHPLPVVLCHYPIARWDRRHYGSIHLYGHTHGMYNNGGRSMDVGVDAAEYYPLSLDDIVKCMLKVRLRKSPAVCPN